MAFNTNYRYKKQLTIDHTKVGGGGTLSNFPLLVAWTDPDLRSVANGGLVQSDSGFDLIFVNGSETAELDHEIERYSATTGEIEMWVRLPDLSASADTTLYCYFGNSRVTTSQENAPGVWDGNFQAVFHLADNAASTAVKDSTANAHAGTNVANTSTKTTTGQVGGALTYASASSDYTNINATAPLLATGDVTYAFWFKPAVTFDVTATSLQYLVSLSDNPSSNDIKVSLSNTTGKLTFQCNGATGTPATTETSWTGGAWYHVAAVYGASAGVRIYINGAADGTSASAGTRGATAAAEMDLGRQFNGLYFNGALDEVHLSNTARSAGWIATEYANQGNPQTFVRVGQTQPSISPFPRYVPRALGSTLIPPIVTQPLAYVRRPLGGTLIDEARTFIPRALGGVYLPDDPTLVWAPRGLGGTLQIAGNGLAGTLPGVGVLSPTLTASLNLGTLTLTGVGTFAGTSSMATALTATFAGIGTFAGSAPLLATALTVALAGVGTLAGPLSASLALPGITLAGVGTLSGSMAVGGNVALTVALAGVGTLTGSGTWTTALASTLSAAGTLTGTPSLSTALAATLAGAGTLTGTLLAKMALAETSTGVGTLAGALLLSTTLTRTLTGAGTLSGTYTLHIALALTVVGTGTLSGVLQLPAFSYLTATWVTRDGIATWIARDGTITWATRDEQAAWKARS